MQLVQLEIVKKNGKIIMFTMEKTEFDNTPIEKIKEMISKLIK